MYNVEILFKNEWCILDGFQEVSFIDAIAGKAYAESNGDTARIIKL